MKYRPDIDGLRAVAVLSVVIYHLDAYLFGMTILPGGFVGVDIFFVISGYLITKLIHKEIVEKRYSILEFYSRRARRIFPALFFMSGVSAAVALSFYLPSMIEGFRDSLIASTLFFSNIYFYLTADYFAPGAETQPLLHTWSLAVEEQFYIFFPFVLILIRRFSTVMQTKLILGLAMLSFAVSVWLLKTDPSGAFYFIQSRAWELMIGSYLAMGTVPPIRNAKLAESFAAVGLLLIAGSILFYSSNTPFPGPAALLPCLGAALIIHAGSHARSYTGSFLSLPPLRFVGLISYSLYLWHWPIIVLTQFIAFWYMLDDSAKLIKVVALGLSFIAATLSWHFVERPFRHGAVLRASNVTTLVTSGSVMTLLVLCAFQMTSASGQLWNLAPDVARVLAVGKDRTTGAFRKCLLSPATGNNDVALFDRTHCLAMSSTKKNYIVIGDSHAQDLMVGLTKVYPDINFLQATSAGCKPVIHGEGSRWCTDLMRMTFEDFLPKNRVDAVLLSARWKPDDLPVLKKTLKDLAKYSDRIVVFGPRVEYKHDLPDILAAGMVQDEPSMIKHNRQNGPRATDALFRAELAHMNIKYFSLYQAICPEEECRTTTDSGTPLSMDYGHFTEDGSTFVATTIKEWGGLQSPTQTPQ